MIINIDIEKKIMDLVEIFVREHSDDVEYIQIMTKDTGDGSFYNEYLFPYVTEVFFKEKEMDVEIIDKISGQYGIYDAENEEWLALCDACPEIEDERYKFYESCIRYADECFEKFGYVV